MDRTVRTAGTATTAITTSVVAVTHGAGAIDRLAELVAARADPLAPLTVLVPSNYATVGVRRALGARGGAAQVAVLTPLGLASQLVARELAEEGWSPLSAAQLGALVRAELDAAPGPFARVARHPTTEAAIVSAYAELAEVLAGLGGARPPATPTVAFVQRVRDRVLARQRFDGAFVVGRARERLVRDGAVDLGQVVFFLLDEVGLADQALLETLLGRAPVAVLHPRTGEAELDERADRQLGRWGLEVPGPLGALPVPHRIVSAVDADDEARLATEQVVAAANDGVPFARQAVLWAADAPYARLVRARLTAAGVPLAGPTGASLGHTAAGRLVLALLGLRAAGRDLRREDVMGLLSGTPVRLGDGRLAPVAEWERVSRNAGIVEGLDQWLTRLERYGEALAADAGNDELTQARRDRAQELGEGSGRLARFVAELAVRLDDLAAATSWKERADRLRALVDQLTGGDTGRRGWPPSEGEAMAAVSRVLERLSGLDRFEPPPAFSVFSRVVARELEAAAPGTAAFGSGVLVGPLSLAPGLEFDRVTVVGLAEGLYPPARREDPLLPDNERLAAVGALRTRADWQAAERRALHAAVAAAPEAVLSAPRTDPRRPAVAHPSRWLRALASQLAGVPSDEVDLSKPGPPWLEVRTSFQASLELATPAVDPADLALRHLHRAWRVSGSAAAARNGEWYPDVVRGLECLASRRAPLFSEWDGNLNRRVNLPQFGGAVAATRLEQYPRCPHAYFLQHVLGVELVDLPEELDRISALTLGSLMHEVLEWFFADALARFGAGEWPATWGDAERARLRDHALERCAAVEDAGQTGRIVLWQIERARLLADLDRVLDRDALHRSAGWKPVAIEAGFGAGFGDDVAIALPGGRQLAVRGKVDRIDRNGDAVLVIDYKSGKAVDYAKLASGDPTAAGKYLQLPIYAAAARQRFGSVSTGAAYWMISARGDHRLLHNPLDQSRYERFVSVLETVVHEIEAGRFPARPDPARGGYIACHYCDPDGLGTVEAYRNWQQTKQAAELSDYVGLIETTWVDDADSEPDPGSSGDAEDAP